MLCNIISKKTKLPSEEKDLRQVRLIHVGHLTVGDFPVCLSYKICCRRLDSLDYTSKY